MREQRVTLSRIMARERSRINQEMYLNRQIYIDKKWISDCLGLRGSGKRISRGGGRNGE
jgi:hypothetical protein